MKLEFDKDQLLKLMKDFYILTGIRVVLYDDEYHQLLSWPEKDCAFAQESKVIPNSAGNARKVISIRFNNAMTGKI